jgi:hypothetical protein
LGKGTALVGQHSFTLIIRFRYGGTSTIEAHIPVTYEGA